MFTAGLFDRPAPNASAIHNNVTSDAHNALARQFAAASTVLLQNNNGLLPLSSTTPKKIAVIGDACSVSPIVHGDGSGQVSPPYVITVLQGVTAAAAQGSIISYSRTSPVADAVTAAENADVAIVCTATVSSEGFDRMNLNLPFYEDDLIQAVAAAQNKTVVVVSAPGAVLTPWAKDVGAILVNFMPGQEAGNAIADVIFGAVNPSGKLPLTFPAVENQVGFQQSQYPGLPANNPVEANYSEGLFVGYRWYDAYQSVPAFPFGHGLSYTTFQLGNVQASPTSVQAILINTGSVAGAEVLQLYIAFPQSAGEPPQQLKGFAKVHLAPGASTQVSFNVTQRDLSIWDVASHSWQVVNGTFTALLGSSSRNILGSDTFTV